MNNISPDAMAIALQLIDSSIGLLPTGFNQNEMDAALESLVDPIAKSGKRIAQKGETQSPVQGGRLPFVLGEIFAA